MSQALMKISVPFKKFMQTTIRGTRTGKSTKGGVSTLDSKYENLEAGPRRHMKGDSESQIALRETTYELRNMEDVRMGR